MDDQEFWDRAFLRTLGGMVAKHGDTQSDVLAMRICRDLADAALTARQERMKPTPQEKTES